MAETIFHSKSTTTILGSSFFWALLAHGSGIFNKYSTHDDIVGFGIGETYTSGRWMLAKLGDFYEAIFGTGFFSTPVFNAFFSILFIALITVFVVDIIQIRSRFLLFALCGVMVSFPVITGLFGFMFTAPYYLFGCLLGIIGVWVIVSKANTLGYFLGVLLMALSAGVYQANIPVYTSFILIAFIAYSSENTSNSTNSIAKVALRNASAPALSILLYVALNSLFLRQQGLTLSSYHGIDDFGKTSAIGYLNRICIAYKEFLRPTPLYSRCMYPMGTYLMYTICLILGCILGIVLIVSVFKQNRFNGIITAAAMCFIPFATNLIYVMCDINEIHTLMMYSESFNFIFLIWMIDHFKVPAEKMNRILHWIPTAVLFLTCIIYCKFDNICYLKAEYQQAEVNSYLTSLITMIKSSEGYEDEMPVYYIGEFGKFDVTFPQYSNFDVVNIIPYSSWFSINDYAWRRSMAKWCGFFPYEGLPELYTSQIAIAESTMPNYPDEGSIKVIDGVLFVKFSDAE